MSDYLWLGTYQPLAHPVERLDSLLRHVFHRHKTHAGPRHGFGNGCRIAHIIFIRFHIGLDVLGCDRSIPNALCQQLLMLRDLSRVDTRDRNRFRGQIPLMDLMPDVAQLNHPEVHNHLAPLDRP